MNIKAALYLGPSFNVASSKIVHKLKVDTCLKYHQTYRTVNLSMTRAIGAYFALFMRFGKLLLAVPMVVLENNSYEF